MYSHLLISPEGRVSMLSSDPLNPNPASYLRMI